MAFKKLEWDVIGCSKEYIDSNFLWKPLLQSKLYLEIKSTLYISDARVNINTYYMSSAPVLRSNVVGWGSDLKNKQTTF